jgi:serine/threonine protein phosphatase PrpC
MGVYKSFAITVQGGSHIKEGKGCQDACFKSDNSALAIAVVADGHGDNNSFRSDRGAKLAVACAAKGIEEFVKIHEQIFNSGILDMFDNHLKI